MKAGMTALPLLILAMPATLASAQQDRQAAPLTGEELFQQKCNQCHDGAQWGTRALARRVAPEQAELLARSSIPAALVKVVVRRGIGSMPQFTPTDLTDEELDRLAQWLETRQ